MKLLIILGLIVVAGGGYFTLDFTAPVLEPVSVPRTIMAGESSELKMRFEEEEDSVTCLLEKTSGPTFFKWKDGYEPGEPIEWPISINRLRTEYCVIREIGSKEPGEASFNLTATDSSGNVSTTTVSLTVTNSRPPKICSNGSGEIADAYGKKCCIDEQLRTPTTVRQKGKPSYTKYLKQCSGPFLGHFR